MPDLEPRINQLASEINVPGGHRYAKFIRSGNSIWYDARREALHVSMVRDAGWQIEDVEDSGRLRVRQQGQNALLDIYGIAADLKNPTLEQRNDTLRIAARIVEATSGMGSFKTEIKNTWDLYND